MCHSTSIESSRPSVGRRLVADSESNGSRSRSSGAASDDGEIAHHARPPNGNPMSRLRWVSRLLVFLVFLCLVLAGWVWYQIYRILW
jgi:hypothetical protein